MSQSGLPRYDEFMLPALEALTGLGGSARRDEVISAVADSEGLTDEQLEARYETTGASVAADRIGWALSYLKKIGAVDNSSRGVWAITDAGRRIESPSEIDERLRTVRAELAARAAERKLRVQSGVDDNNELDFTDETDPDAHWQSTLLKRLLEMTPAAFERLTQRLLREAGFREVEVLGQSGDGGLDGVGVYRLSLVSFPIYFQCKRYSGSVSSSAVRDFRGAMAGRGEKGLLVTTGTFTRGARDEASRDGAPPVQLIDGEDLCDLLKEYRLGVSTRIRSIEDIEIDNSWFEQFEPA
ncbi:restriction endonuclease [Candidatus Poriferisodalis sp.]|uniref:restriction endonuclease n=1 Tax=Candidatus Poriferisodalis sp. TaxID=3101277 RepID=UPI003B52709E